MIGLGFLFIFVFFIFSEAGLMHLQMCVLYLLELVLILKWCWEARRKFTLGLVQWESWEQPETLLRETNRIWNCCTRKIENILRGKKRTVGYHSCCCWFILVRNEKFCPFSPETRLNRSSLEVYVRWWPWVAIIFMMGANEEDRWCDKVYMEEVGGDVCVVWNQKLLLTWFQLV